MKAAAGIRRLNEAIISIFFLVISLFVLYPLVYVISAAFSPSNSIATLNIVPFGDGFTLKHFSELFFNTEYPLWFFNSLCIAVATSLASILIASLAAYVFSRFQFLFKKSMMLTLLILQVFPSFIGMVAVYVILLRIGGLDSLWGLCLVYVAGSLPYNTWLVKTYLDTLSPNLDEAARIDGAGHFRIWFTIIMPLARPIISFLGITSFCAPWMDFIFPKMVLRSPEKQTLALGLFSFVSDKKNEFTLFAAGALIVAIPFVILFIMTQKMILTSFAQAAVKE